MPVYVDGLRCWGMRIRGREVKSCHLTADSDDELEEFAARMGFPPSWRHNGSRPHFDLTASQRERCLAAGAIVRKRRNHDKTS